MSHTNIDITVQRPILGLALHTAVQTYTANAQAVRTAAPGDSDRCEHDRIAAEFERLAKEARELEDAVMEQRASRLVLED